MPIANIKIEGLAEIAFNRMICICGKCGNHDTENATIEFNFREQKVIYTCSQCQNMNEMVFGKEMPAPYPHTRMGR